MIELCLELTRRLWFPNHKNYVIARTQHNEIVPMIMVCVQAFETDNRFARSRMGEENATTLSSNSSQEKGNQEGCRRYSKSSFATRNSSLLGEKVLNGGTGTAGCSS